MTAVSVSVKGTKPSGDRVVEAVIVSDTAPTALPATGADIVGLRPTDTFAPFSLLYVTGDAENKVYIANEQGVFIPQ